MKICTVLAPLFAIVKKAYKWVKQEVNDVKQKLV